MNYVYGIGILTVIWGVLRESFSLETVAVGVAVSLCCLLIMKRFLPLPEIPEIKPIRFILYLLFLIGKVYTAGLTAMKTILAGAQSEIVEVPTGISNICLKAILVNSITLVPGSVALDLENDKITVLWLKKAGADATAENADEQIKGELERMLLKAQK